MGISSRARNSAPRTCSEGAQDRPTCPLAPKRTCRVDCFGLCSGAVNAIFGYRAECGRLVLEFAHRYWCKFSATWSSSLLPEAIPFARHERQELGWRVHSQLDFVTIAFSPSGRALDGVLSRFTNSNWPLGHRGCDSNSVCIWGAAFSVSVRRGGNSPIWGSFVIPFPLARFAFAFISFPLHREYGQFLLGSLCIPKGQLDRASGRLNQS
jgi:hypothetical protein